MNSPIGNFIRERRLALGLKQEELAQKLGMSRATFARYDSGERNTPVSILPDLANAIEVDVAFLESLRDRAPRSSVEAVRDYAPLTPLSCSIAEMLTRMPGARRLHEAVHASISEGQYRDLSANFLRQTAPELALAFLGLLDAAKLVWTSPLEAGSRQLCIGDDRRAYHGHLLRLAISWQRDRERIVLFPQVPLLVPKGDRRYRVDYLAVHAVPGRPPSDVVVELDGQPHAIQTVRDEARAEDLSLPLIRFDNQAVLSERLFTWLVGSIRSKAEAARISHGEYSRYLKRRRQQFDALERRATP